MKTLNQRRANPMALSLVIFFAPLFFVSGCGPKYSYPSDAVLTSIENICKSEFKLDVKAAFSGKTLGATTYLDSIMDTKGQIPKEVHEAMGKMMQVVSRVALATDRPVDYLVVSLRDRKQLNELLITRSLDDTRRANADAIGIEESMNRTVFGQGRYQPEESEKRLFELKEVKKESFLAEQMVQRIRFNFSKNTKEDASKTTLLADGNFDEFDRQRVFRISIIALKTEDPKQLILDIFKVVSGVLGGYSFKDYDSIEIQDYLNRQKLVVERATLTEYQAKKLKDKDILERCLVESQSIQEAFKLFGFKMPQDADQDKVIAKTASP